MRKSSGIAEQKLHHSQNGLTKDEHKQRKGLP